MSALRSFLMAARAEAVKEARLHWGRGTNVVLEAVVPILHFAIAWYMFAPFDASEHVRVTGSSREEALPLFLLVGFLGFYVFQRLLWAAMERAYRERDGGTLELLMLSPANRFGLLVGGAASGMVRATWLYLAFLVGSAALGHGWRVAHPGAVIVALLALLVPALAFGTLLQGFLMHAFDTSAYVTLSQPPLSFLSGVRFPVHYLPGWLQAIAALLPLTWSLRAARPLLVEAALLRDVGRELGVLALVSAACFVLAAVVDRRAEAMTRRDGTAMLY